MPFHGSTDGVGERGAAPGAEPRVSVGVLPFAGWYGGAAALGVSVLCFTTQITAGNVKDFANQPPNVAGNPGQVYGYILPPSLLSNHFPEESSPPHQGGTGSSRSSFSPKPGSPLAPHPSGNQPSWKRKF